MRGPLVLSEPLDGGADLVLQAPASSSGTDVHGYGSDDTYWKVWLGVE